MILVSGATGTVGSKVVSALIDKGAAVRVGVRSPDKVQGLAEKGVQVVKLDLSDPKTFGPAFDGTNHFFMLNILHPGAVEEGNRVTDAAKAAGIEHVVKLSALGCDMEPGIQLGRWHRAIEKHIEASGMGWTFLRPNNFMDNFTTFWGQPIKEQGKIFMPLGDGAVSYVDSRDVAAIAVAALTEAGHQGKAYEITGSEALTLHQVAEILGKGIGKEIAYVDIPEEAAAEAMTEMGMPEFLVAALAELNALDKAGFAAGTTDHIRQVTAKDPITFEQWVADNKSAYE